MNRLTDGQTDRRAGRQASGQAGKRAGRQVGRQRLKGFTLLELIIVIAIIAVLMAIAVPSTATMLRDAQVNSANTTAQQLYTATQDYLITLQRKSKDATAYFGIDSSGVGYIGGIAEPAGDDGLWFTSTSAAGIDACSIPSGTVDSEGNALTSAVSNDNKIAAANGILSNMTVEFTGAFLVEIYPKTYTVKAVYYSSEVDRTNTSNAYNYTGVTEVRALHSNSGYANLAEQDKEAQNASSSHRYVGQYPINMN